jgi:integrase
MAKRSYGTGSLFEKGGNWYGQWRIGSRLVKRKLGPQREPGTRRGMTKAQAERELRRAMDEVRSAIPAERVTVEEAGRRYLRHLETVRERKRSTLQDYEIMLRRHLVPFFGIDALDRVTTDEVAAYVQAQRRAGLARQTVINQVNFLHGVCAYGVQRGWISANPVVGVERPRAGNRDPDIRFLSIEELEALLRAIPDDTLGRMDRALYLTAAMTGLRQGELVALRWQDVDWSAGVVRVRRSFSRGQLGTPKSRRSSRAVPLADRVAAELERLFQRSPFQGDADLVFANPQTGAPYDASRLRKRFKRAIVIAGIRDVRFHDLRHTFGTRMAASGAPLRALMEWMGHRDLATTLVYADYAPDPAQGASFAKVAFGDAAVARRSQTDSETV